MGIEDSEAVLVGRRVGSIRIVEKLGEGGMGAVYSGFDEKLQRRVALKTIRSDMTGSANKLRFLREARVLSKLNHPGICSIYDFVEEGGNDLLVLELVTGRSLKKAISDGLDSAAKLRIARQLAEALSVAHSHGVVHRDVKPDNVMLTDQGDVKVLDFGLAQIVSDCQSVERSSEVEVPTPALLVDDDSETTVASPMTVDGRVAGTAAFMSPEQAIGDAAVPASDIYSLGLVFQQLWTERSPHEQGLSRQMLLLKAARAESLPPTGIDSAVADLIRRMKLLAPEARPTGPQVIERLRWIGERPRRRMGRAAAALALVALVLAGAKYTTDLRRERNAALAARTAEEQSRSEAEEVTSFLIDLFAVSRPGTSQGNTVTARELLDIGAEKIVRDLANQPLTQARLAEAIGSVYSLLGLYEPAVELLEEGLRQRQRLLGEGHPEVAASLNALGTCYKAQGRLQEAENLLTRSLAIREKELGPEHQDTWRSTNNLGLLYWDQGRYKEAEELHRWCLELGVQLFDANSSQVASSHNNLGEVLREQGRLEEAETHLRRAHELKKTELGENHPDIASTLNNLGQLCWELQRYEDAEAYFKGALKINRKVLGEDSLSVSANLNNLATLYDELGRTDEAEGLYIRSMEITEKVVGAEHPRVAVALNNLAELYQNSDRPEQALDYYSRALVIFERGLGPSHPYVAHPLVGLAQIYTSWGRVREAQMHYQRALAIREAALGAEHDLCREVEEALRGLGFETG